MNLLILAAVVAACNAAKLDHTYLPPASAKSAGGASAGLQTPFGASFHGAASSAAEPFEGVAVDSAEGAASARLQSGLGGAPETYGSTHTKVGAAAFRGATQNAFAAQGASFNQASSAPNFQSGGHHFDFQANTQDASQGFNPDSTLNYQGASQAFQGAPTGFQGNSQGFQGAQFSSASSYSQTGPERALSAQDRTAHIVRQDSDVTAEGFSYSFETDNGIAAEESAEATDGVHAQGGFSYTADDGQKYSITYTADENGYQPHGDHLPTPPPIPEAILKSIEQNMRDEAAGIVDDGAYDATKYGGGDYAGGNSGKYQEGQAESGHYSHTSGQYRSEGNTAAQFGSGSHASSGQASAQFGSFGHSSVSQDNSANYGPGNFGPSGQASSQFVSTSQAASTAPVLASSQFRASSSGVAPVPRGQSVSRISSSSQSSFNSPSAPSPQTSSQQSYQRSQLNTQPAEQESAQFTAQSSNQDYSVELPSASSIPSTQYSSQGFGSTQAHQSAPVGSSSSFYSSSSSVRAPSVPVSIPNSSAQFSSQVSSQGASVLSSPQTSSSSFSSGSSVRAPSAPVSIPNSAAQFSSQVSSQGASAPSSPQTSSSTFSSSSYARAPSAPVSIPNSSAQFSSQVSSQGISAPSSPQTSSSSFSSSSSVRAPSAPVSIPNSLAQFSSQVSSQGASVPLSQQTSFSQDSSQKYTSHSEPNVQSSSNGESVQISGSPSLAKSSNFNAAYQSSSDGYHYDRPALSFNSPQFGQLASSVSSVSGQFSPQVSQSSQVETGSQYDGELYQYNKPAEVSTSTVVASSPRPVASQKYTSEVQASSSGAKEEFGGPRQPPSFDEQTGYHY